MRIQYSKLEFKEYSVPGNPYSPPVLRWSEWQDWPIGRGLAPVAQSFRVRLVDDSGQEVQQTPGFVPAYYERTSGTQPGGITWCTTPPDKAHWVRRDDIQPSGGAA